MTVSNPPKISFVEPTQNADGSTISAGEITGYSVGYGTATGNYTSSFALPSNATSGVFPSALTPGTYFAAVRAVGPVDSPYSAEVSFTIPQPTPDAPTGFTVA